MSTRYVLDTDTVVDVLRRRAYPRVAERLGALSPDDVAVGALTVAELLFGARRSRAPADARREVLRFVEVIRVVPFGRRAADLHASIRDALRAQPIGPHDLVIAATALGAGAILVTSNVGEFSRVPALAVESWR